MKSITLEDHPNLACILDEDEDVSWLQRSSPEQILIKWVNWQLGKSQYKGPKINNFKKDIKGKLHTITVPTLNNPVYTVYYTDNIKIQMHTSISFHKFNHVIQCRRFQTTRALVQILTERKKCWKMRIDSIVEHLSPKKTSSAVTKNSTWPLSPICSTIIQCWNKSRFLLFRKHAKKKRNYDYVLCSSNYEFQVS